MGYADAIAEAIVEYYRIESGCSNEDIDNAQIVLKSLWDMTHDKWYMRAINECEQYRHIDPDWL